MISRVRHGAYMPRASWTSADQQQRHLFRAQAVTLSHGHVVALSHQSAALATGLRLWNSDLSRVHVLRLDGGPSRIHNDVVYHGGGWCPDDIWQSEEMLVVSPVRAAVGAASLQSIEGGVVVLDSWLDVYEGDPAALDLERRRVRGHPSSARLEMSVRLAQPGAESVGESRGRVLCFFQHLPRPVLQFEVYDDAGRLVARVDFAWPEHRLFGEFDGRVKYGRLLKPGENIADVVSREKEREDLIREITDFLMIRFVWSDYDRPRTTAARIRRKMAAGSATA